MTTDTVVARLHRALVEALWARGPDALERPVTVAEIYQDLIPYRAVRGLAGVEMNADYEHALFRLLAGENGHIRLEPAAAQEELRRELQSPNPNVTLYRKFAACDAWVAAPSDRTATAGPRQETSMDGPAGRTAPAGRAQADAAEGAGAPTAPAAPAAGESRTVCAFCSKRLPSGRAVRFCPFCGMDQERRPCRTCGEVLDRGWLYCITCGEAAGG